MSITVQFAMEGEEFRLGSLLEGGGSTDQITFERTVPCGEPPLSQFWRKGGDRHRFVRRLRASEDVRSLRVLVELPEATCYRVGWSDEAIGLFSEIGPTEGTILGADLTDRWRFRIRFPEHRNLREFHSLLEERDCSVDIRRVGTPQAPGGHSATERLSQSQRETLQLATEAGYFEVPRETTLEDLGARLNISSQAVSERLRRGLGTVLEELFASPGENETHAPIEQGLFSE